MKLGQKIEASIARRSAEALYEEGKKNLELRLYPEAVRCFQEAALSAKGTNSAALVERSLFELGRTYSELGYSALAEKDQPSAIGFFHESLKALEDCRRLGAVYPFQSAVIANQISKTLKGLGAQKEKELPAGPTGESSTALALRTVPFHEWGSYTRKEAMRSANAALFALLADYDTKEAQRMGLMSAANEFMGAAKAAQNDHEHASAKAGEATARALLGIFNEQFRDKQFQDARECFKPAIEQGLISEKKLREATKTAWFKPSPEDLEKAAIAFVALGEFEKAEKALSRASRLWFERGVAELKEELASYLTFTRAVDSANWCFMRCQDEERALIASLYESSMASPYTFSLASSTTVKLDMALAIFKLNAWFGIGNAYEHLRSGDFSHLEVMRRLERSGSMMLALPLLCEYLAGGEEESKMACEILVKSTPVSVSPLISAAMQAGSPASERAKDALREILKARTCLAEQVQDIKAALGE